jgi:arylsulfatase A-like enzyme
MNKHAILLAAVLSLFVASETRAAVQPSNERPANFVVIFCDDLGYGDLQCFGSMTIKTPHLDAMAEQGQKWTQFYVGACVCTPSRAALLTGRLPIRSGMCSSRRRVLFPDSKGGLPASEITIAEALKAKGYATACVGKWHLGHLPEFLPTAHGFDSYYGIPYSNDMGLTPHPKGKKRLGYYDANKAVDLSYWGLVPLMEGDKIIERPVDQTTITRRYTEHAVEFINENKDKPFFLYLAHNMPHVPLFRSEKFTDVSQGGIFGDVIEEIDWSVGQVLGAVRDSGLDKNTIVVFTSDNGPWLWFTDHGGSAGPLRGGKGGTFEGGMREPTVVWGPGIVKPGVVNELGATMDLLPTFCSLAGIKPPTDRTLDGHDLSAVVRGTGKSPRQTVFYYLGTEVWAVRHGDLKMHLKTVEPAYGRGRTVKAHDPPLLFNLAKDIAEKEDIAASHADEIAKLRKLIAAHRESIKPVPNQLERQ